MKVRSLTAIFFGLTILASACGDSAIGSDDSEYLAGVRESLEDDIKNENDEFAMSAKTAECAADKLIDSVGEQKLKDGGVTAENAPDKIEDVADDKDFGVLLLCLSDEELAQAFGGGDDQAAAECAIEEIGGDRLRKEMSEAVSSEDLAALDGLSSEFDAALANC